MTVHRVCATVVVAGMLFNGMSTRVVTPPAAAARVAVSNPSQAVRPGSLMCTCVSTMPGDTTMSPTLKISAPGGSSLAYPTMRSMMPFSM